MRKVYHGATQEIIAPLVTALGELAKHRPNNQICILKQAVVDKYLIFQKSVLIK